MMFSKKEAIGFCCDPLRDGPTYSLTTYLGKLLLDAESQYGPRDSRWTLLGIEFFDAPPEDPRPCIWYPGNKFHIAIRLTESARLDTDEAIFQLAHEVIHLLSPAGGGPAKVIEEGLATIFAHQSSNKAAAHPKYLQAEKLTQELLSLNPNAIIELRKGRFSFSDFTADFLTQAFPALSFETAKLLCEIFERDD